MAVLIKQVANQQRGALKALPIMGSGPSCRETTGKRDAGKAEDGAEGEKGS